MEPPSTPDRKKQTLRNIGLVVTVIAVIMAVVIIESLKQPYNQISVKVNSVTVDHADEVLARDSGQTAFIFSISVTDTGTGIINIAPAGFSIMTAAGSYVADSSGSNAFVTNPLGSVTITKGQTASGQLYIALPSGTIVESLSYSYGSHRYRAAAPDPSNWISWIEGVNVTVNGQYSSSESYAYSATSVGNVMSGSSFLLNISYTNENLTTSQVIDSVSAFSPFSTGSANPPLSISVAGGRTVYLDVSVLAPSQSYFGNVTINLETT